MRVMVVGLGVIGTAYAYCFQKAGHLVEHLVRDNKRSACPETIEIELFDGRYDPKGKAKNDHYSVSIAPANSHYDFIFISVSAGKLENVVRSLDEKNIHGTLVLFCGIWENREALDKVLNGREYILGYPVAGGNLEGQKINCVLFDHIMLESRQKAQISNYDSLLELLGSADIKVEIP